MKIFMTGVCGRLGRVVSKIASQTGHQLVGLDIAPWPERIMPQPAGVTVHQGSYTDMDLVRQLLAGCNAIIHAGGLHGEFVGKSSTADFIEAHTSQLVRVLEEGVAQGVTNAVLCSTMEVLIGRNWSASGMTYMDEETPVRTDSAYSLSRRLMEVMGREFSLQHGMSIASLRFMAFGYGDDLQSGQKLLARCVAAEDVARVVLLAAAKPHLRGEIFNIGPETPLTAMDISQAMTDPFAVLERYFPGSTAIMEKSGKPVTSNYFWPVTDIRKARNILGWQPQYTFRHWLLEQGWQPPAQDADTHSSLQQAAR